MKKYNNTKKNLILLSKQLENAKYFKKQIRSASNKVEIRELKRSMKIALKLQELSQNTSKQHTSNASNMVWGNCALLGLGGKRGNIQKYLYGNWGNYQKYLYNTILLNARGFSTDKSENHTLQGGGGKIGIFNNVLKDIQAKLNDHKTPINEDTQLELEKIVREQFLDFFEEDEKK